MKKDNKGHISIHRTILDNWVWGRGPKSIFEAWVFILLKANWQDARIPVSGELITVKRGEFFTSQKQLAEEFKWDRKRVKSFLDMLQRDSMITLKTFPRYCLITICKYDSYQTLGTRDEHERDMNSPSIPLELPTTNKNNNYNKEYIMSAIAYLNEKTGKDFKWNSRKSATVITARSNEGYTIEDFKRVIDCKVSKWINDEKMRDYLRPETLFGNKFEGYLNECKNSTPKQTNYVDHDEYIFGPTRK